MVCIMADNITQVIHCTTATIVTSRAVRWCATRWSSYHYQLRGVPTDRLSLYWVTVVGVLPPALDYTP